MTLVSLDQMLRFLPNGCLDARKTWGAMMDPATKMTMMKRLSSRWAQLSWIYVTVTRVTYGAVDGRNCFTVAVSVWLFYWLLSLLYRSYSHSCKLYMITHNVYILYTVNTYFIAINHHSFPTKTWLLSSAAQLSYPNKAVLVKQGEAPPPVVGGFNEMEALAELNEERKWMCQYLSFCYRRWSF